MSIFVGDLMLTSILLTMMIAQAEPVWPNIGTPIPNIAVNTSNDSALIIAIEDYSHIDDVQGALQNGQDWKQYFRVSANIPSQRVRYVSNDYAFKSEILRHARELSENTPSGGKIWLVYIGHGASNGEEAIFLDVDARAMPTSFGTQLTQSELIDVLQTQHDVVALIDACFSGRSDDGIAFLQGTQFAAPTSLLEMPKATIITAARHNEYAGSIDGLNRPAFSYLALGALRGWADTNGDGVSLNELTQYSKESLQSTVMGRSQTPTLTGNGRLVVSKGKERAPSLVVSHTQSQNANNRSSGNAVVEGGNFSLDVVGQANKLAEQIAQLEQVIVRDLDQKEREIKSKASSQWNSSDFVNLRRTSPRVAVDAVNRFVDAYSTVTVKYPEEVAIPISVPLSRKVSIPEVQQARDWLRDNGTPDELDGNGYTAKLIPAGTFTMGCTSEQGSDCYNSEKPTHQVTISKDFYLMESEVTQALYQRVMGENPSKFKGANRPVETVSWYDAVKFCNKLSQMEGLDQCYTINGSDVSWSNKSCNGWRLPTEAEWEYAARGGQNFKYAGSNNLSSVAWYGFYHEDDSNRTVTTEGTKDVCGKSRNGYGLCDMSGNVWEWVWDWYGDYSSQSGTDLVGPSSGQNRVFRGGSWSGDARSARVSFRNDYTPDFEYDGLGFRPGRTP